MPPLRNRRSPLRPPVVIHAIAAAALAQSRGALELRTAPDSAWVLLDGAERAEEQRTPYANASMIPGMHRILVRPADPLLQPAFLDVRIAPGERTSLDLELRARQQASGLELPPIPEGRFRIEVAASLQRTEGTASTGSLATPASGSGYTSFPDASTPRSLGIPFVLRAGLPGGFELRLRSPAEIGWTPASKTETVMGDPLVGAKWGIPGSRLALDASISLGSSRTFAFANRSDAFSSGIVLLQEILGAELAANLSYSFRFHSMDTSHPHPSDLVSLALRFAVPATDRILPYLAASADYAPPSDGNRPTLLLSARPGLCINATSSWSLEAGAPISLAGIRQPLRWGLLLATGVSFGPAWQPASARRSTMPAGVPLPAGASHLLFSPHETTNAEYRLFCERTGHPLPLDPDFPGMPAYPTDPRWDSFPVVGVSLVDARAYATWRGARLPTPSEWSREVAGTEIDPGRIACGLEAPVAAVGTGPGASHLVGNVAEWLERDGSGPASCAGGHFTLPKSRCLDPGRRIESVSPGPARHIGIRLVTEVR